MRVVGYVRVSTERQAEEGFGLAVQTEAIVSWASEGDRRLVGVHRDGGVSGTTEARPGLTEALAIVERGDADALVVARMDRLARTLTVQEAILAHAWKSGATVFSVDVGEILQDDPADPMRTFVRQVMGAAAQLERGMITARMRAGREHKMSNGGYGGGGVPLGYRCEGGALVPDEREQRVLRRMTELRGCGASLRTIASTLESEGLYPRRSRRWSAGTLGPIVARLSKTRVTRL